jgi:hypothetical protein
MYGQVCMEHIPVPGVEKACPANFECRSSFSFVAPFSPILKGIHLVKTGLKSERG